MISVLLNTCQGTIIESQQSSFLGPESTGTLPDLALILNWYDIASAFPGWCKIRFPFIVFNTMGWG